MTHEPPIMLISFGSSQDNLKSWFLFINLLQPQSKWNIKQNKTKLLPELAWAIHNPLIFWHFKLLIYIIIYVKQAKQTFSHYTKEAKKQQQQQHRNNVNLPLQMRGVKNKMAITRRKYIFLILLEPQLKTVHFESIWSSYEWWGEKQKEW